MRRHTVHQGIPSPAPNTVDTSPENAGNDVPVPLDEQHERFLPLAFEEGFDECPVAKNRCDGRRGGRHLRSGRGIGTGGVGSDRRGGADVGRRRGRPAVVVVVQAGPHRPDWRWDDGRRGGHWDERVWNRRWHRWDWQHQWRDNRYCAAVRTDGPPRQFDGPPRQFDGPPRQFDGPPRQFDGPPRTRRDRGPADPDARPVGPPRGAVTGSTRRRSGPS